MEPVLDELARRYPDNLIIARIDTSEEMNKAKELNVITIPTQIFYDQDGREVFRHVGFYSVDEIVGRWKELGFDLRKI